MLNLNQLLPPLRVHSWGGLGSQLNALAFTLDFLALNPGRRVHLVIHTGGVTRRSMEIAELLPTNVTWSEIDDFVNKSNTQKSKTSLRYFASLLSDKLRIAIFPENNSDLKRIKFWTISSRGHYSYIRFSESTIIYIFELIKKSDVASMNDKNIIHYRLGDLLSVGKAFIAPSDILQLIETLGIQTWHVLTDSPEAARKMFNKLSDKISIEGIHNLPPLTLIKSGFQSRIFVGTTSKLSIWICIFRVYLNSGLTFMPIELRMNLSQLIKDPTPKNLDYY